MLLANNSTYPVGLDISDLSIKLVQLNKIRDKIKIQALGKLTLPLGVITNGVINDRAELIKAIKKIIAAPGYGKVSSEEAVVCLPESKTFIKRIEVAKSPNSLADVIGAEIEKHVPMSKSEIYYDWQVTAELADKYQVLIGAAPKEIVDQYAQLLDDAKLSVAAMEIEPTAICRCLLKEEAPEAKPAAAPLKPGRTAPLNYGIIDIGANHTCLIFYSDNTIVFSVSMPISGEEITAKISRTLNLTPEQAEKAKIICGLDETKANGVIKKILEETIKNLISKIKEALDFYENYYGGKLNKILLCGGGGNITELGKIIAQEFSIKVETADALTNLDETGEKFNPIFMEKHSFDAKLLKNDSSREGNNLSIQQNSGSTFTTAIGLALRGIFIDEL